jgi:mannose-6-phosphate isomerase-like protein (cupin superfamily)
MEIINLETTISFTTKDGSSIRELLSHRNSEIRNQSLAEATVPPGVRTLAHYHPRAEEIYYILQGEGVMHFADMNRDVRPGDAVVIPPGQVHWIENTKTTDLVFLCCCAPGYEHEDTVMVEFPSQP